MAGLRPRGVPCNDMGMSPASVLKPVSAFLFDIGNVLLRFDFGRTLRALAAKSRVSDPGVLLGAVDVLKAGYEDGGMDRATFLREVFALLEFRGSEREFVTAWEEIFEPNLPMVALVERLWGRYPLFLLSNTNDIHREYIFREYPFFKRFSGGIYSYEVGASKPGPESYRIACERLGLEPEGTFFIDDLLPNIETARSLGFHAHHYHHAEHEALLGALPAEVRV